MGCGCRGTTTPAALAAVGGPAPTTYRAELPDGTSQIYLTDLEAQRAVRRAGGGRIIGVTAP